MVWERLSIPKHRFVLWLAWLERLKTKDWLVRTGVTLDRNCLLCGVGNENINHLFFECFYSKQVLEAVMVWLEWKCAARSLKEVYKWISKAKMSIVRKRILYAVIGVVVYHVWRVRNEALWEAKVSRIQHTVQRIEKEILLRIKLVMPKKANIKDREWIESKCTK